MAYNRPLNLIKVSLQFLLVYQLKLNKNENANV